MKDGIGEGYTTADHPEVSNQMFSAYAKVQDVRALASVIGEDELSDTDRLYIKFGQEFEKRFVGQGKGENRDIKRTIDIAWELLRILPKSELDRISPELLDKKY